MPRNTPQLSAAQRAQYKQYHIDTLDRLYNPGKRADEFENTKNAISWKSVPDFFSSLGTTALYGANAYVSMFFPVSRIAKYIERRMVSSESLAYRRFRNDEGIKAHIATREPGVGKKKPQDQLEKKAFRPDGTSILGANSSMAYGDFKDFFLNLIAGEWLDLPWRPLRVAALVTAVCLLTLTNPVGIAALGLAVGAAALVFYEGKLYREKLHEETFNDNKERVEARKERLDHDLSKRQGHIENAVQYREDKSKGENQPSYGFTNEEVPKDFEKDSRHILSSDEFLALVNFYQKEGLTNQDIEDIFKQSEDKIFFLELHKGFLKGDVSPGELKECMDTPKTLRDVRREAKSGKFENPNAHRKDKDLIKHLGQQYKEFAHDNNANRDLSYDKEIAYRATNKEALFLEESMLTNEEEAKKGSVDKLGKPTIGFCTIYALQQHYKKRLTEEYTNNDVQKTEAEINQKVDEHIFEHYAVSPAVGLNAPAGMTTEQHEIRERFLDQQEAFEAQQTQQENQQYQSEEVQEVLQKKPYLSQAEATKAVQQHKFILTPEQTMQLQLVLLAGGYSLDQVQQKLESDQQSVYPSVALLWVPTRDLEPNLQAYRRDHQEPAMNDLNYVQEAIYNLERYRGGSLQFLADEMLASGPRLPKSFKLRGEKVVDRIVREYQYYRRGNPEWSPEECCAHLQHSLLERYVIPEAVLPQPSGQPISGVVPVLRKDKEAEKEETPESYRELFITRIADRSPELAAQFDVSRLSKYAKARVAAHISQSVAEQQAPATRMLTPEADTALQRAESQLGGRSQTQSSTHSQTSGSEAAPAPEITPAVDILGRQSRVALNRTSGLVRGTSSQQTTASRTTPTGTSTASQTGNRGTSVASQTPRQSSVASSVSGASQSSLPPSVAESTTSRARETGTSALTAENLTRTESSRAAQPQSGTWAAMMGTTVAPRAGSVTSSNARSAQAPSRAGSVRSVSRRS